MQECEKTKSQFLLDNILMKNVRTSLLLTRRKYLRRVSLERDRLWPSTSRISLRQPLIRICVASFKRGSAVSRSSRRNTRDAQCISTMRVLHASHRHLLASSPALVRPRYHSLSHESRVVCSHCICYI